MFKKLLFSLLSFVFIFTTKAQQSVTFNYTGALQTWIVPACVYSIQVDARGAKGGGTQGGNGARVQATLAVVPGQLLHIYVGGMGTCGNNSAGWNGGGNGCNASGAGNESCGGGGASDIRISPFNLTNRLVIAAGGGGMGGGTSNAVGGNGGCTNGSAGTSPFGQGGGGASSISGGNGGPPWIPSGTAGSNGLLGIGGNGGIDNCYNNSPGGGGGGGYYGGGGGGSDCFGAAPYGGGSGGGGSSFYAGVGTCTQGFQTGNGQIIISYNSVSINNVPPLCEGATLNLVTPSVLTSYQWAGPNNFVSTIQNPSIPNINTSMSGIYTLTNGQCTTSVNIVIQPNVTATFNQISDLCINSPAPALPTTSTNTNPYTGTWSPATITTAVAGTATYTFTPTAGQCAFPATMDIVTHALTTPQFNPMGQICQYMTGVVIPTTATNTTSYLNGPLITGTWNSPTVVTTSPGTVNYTFTPDPNQCASTLIFPISVDPLIIPQFTQIPQLCQDDANPIFPTTSNNVPGITGAWTPPNIDTSIPGIFSHTFLPDPGQCSDTVDMIVTIVPAVPPTFVADTLSGCNPLLVGLSTIGAVQGAQYTWYWNGTTIGTGNTLYYNFDASGYHDITLEYNLLGCIETTTYDDYIYMENYPSASFAAFPGSLAETTVSIQFVNNSVGAISYLWDFDDQTTSTEQNPNHNYIDITDNLLVTLTTSTSLGCSDEYQLNIPVIAEPIYYLPNTFTPDEDEHNQTWQAIFTTGFDPHSFHLAVFNRWGELIWETFDATQAWDGTYGHDGNKVPSGVYIWKLQFEPKENDYRKIVSGHLNLIR